MSDKRTASMSDLKEGKFVIIDGHPCRVIKIQTSRPGKHGHAKYRVSAESVTDGSKHNLMGPSDTKIEIPMLDKRSAQVLRVSGGEVQLMDLENFETFTLEVPKGKEMEEGGKTYYWIVLGQKLLELA